MAKKNKKYKLNAQKIVLLVLILGIEAIPPDDVVWNPTSFIFGYVG